MDTNFKMENKYITMIKGDTFSIGIKCVDEKEQPIENISAVTMTCRDSENNKIIFQKSIGDGVEKSSEDSNIYIIRVAPSDTETTEAGKYVYDVEIRTNGDVFTILKGNLQIDDDVTKAGTGGREYKYNIVSIKGEKGDKGDSTGSGENSASEFLHNIHVDEFHDDTTDTQYQVIRIYKNKLDGNHMFPFVVAPNGSGAGTQSAQSMNKKYGYKLAINSGIFNMNTGKPDGVVIQNGAIIQDSESVTHPNCRPLTIDANGNLGYAEYDESAAQMVIDGIKSAVCGFMPIVVDYEKFPSSKWNSVNHYTAAAQRQIIGQYGNGDYCIVTSEGRGFDSSTGWTIAQAQDICVHLGLKFAYNLDGGGSTETMILNRQSNIAYEGETGRTVPVFIVFNGTDTAPTEEGTVTYVLNSISVEMSETSVAPNTNTASLIKSVTGTYKGSDGTTHTGKIYSGWTVTPETIALGNNSVIVKCRNVSSETFAVTGVNSAAAEYDFKDYITSSGNSWIDTGVVPTANTSAEYQYMITVTPPSYTSPHILSSDNDFFPTIRYGGDCMTHRGGSEAISDDKRWNHFALNKLYTVSAWRNGNNATFNDNEIKFTNVSYGPKPSTTNLILGHYYADNKFNFGGNIYYLKIYESDTLIRDFVPAVRKSDSVAGMYDKVNKKFYASASGTNFTAN